MRSVWRKSFDSLHICGAYRRNLCLATSHGSASHVHRSRAALADAASELSSLHVEDVSEDPEKGHVRGHIYCCRAPVYSQFVGHIINLLGKRIERRSNHLLGRETITSPG